MSVSIVTRSIWGNSGNTGKRVRKTLSAMVWQLQKRTIRASRILRLPNGVLFRAYPDCVVSSALIYADWPEYHELMFLRKRLQHDQVLIDVGANVGHISLLLADVVGADNIFAIEPTPVSFRRLVENWRLNRWGIEGLFHAAAGAERGGVFVRDVDSPVTTNAVASTPFDGSFAEVPLVRLDDLRHLWERRSLGLLKIDVEGYEHEVFRGSWQVLQRDRPDVIMFESLSGTLEHEIAALMADCKYAVFHLDLRGMPDFTEHSAQNLFAVPFERRGNLES